MKKISLTLVLILISVLYSKAQRAAPPEDPRKVQVAILFDTSNSMDGLIDQAKSRIWNIINEVSTLRYNGQQPSIEIALYQYGNDGLSAAENYIQQVLPLTSDLDLLSQKLFGLTTNGGSEYCGAVIGKSLSDLNWSVNPADLKMIYIAGNESFIQGPVDYKIECKKAGDRGIYINTIYCGNYDQGVREFWQEGAWCSQGDYFNIDSDKAIVHIDTPYDEEINKYNDSLNNTYIGYGKLGSQKLMAQQEQDKNAGSQSAAVKTERSITKSKKGVYNNASWDLMDAVDEGEADLSKMDDKDLPEEFQGKTLEEKEGLLEEKREDRERYQAKINELAKNREEFIATERKKQAEAGEVVDDFGSSVNKSINEKANEVGYTKEAHDEE